MEIWMRAVITFGAAAAGAWCGKRLRIPAGAMVGAIVTSAIWNIASGAAYIPSAARPVLQIAGGILLGHTISKSSILLIRKTGKAVIILIIGLLALNIMLGGILHAVCKMELLTALFAAAPGGVSDMALIAEEFGADTGIISVIQLFRMFGIYLIYPPVLKSAAEYRERAQSKSEQIEEQYHEDVRKDNSTGRISDIAMTILWGTIGGLLWKKTGFPAGALVGSVAACGVFNILTGRGRIYQKIRFPIQVGVGSLIGAQMTWESIISLKNLAIPIGIMLLVLMIYTFILAAWMYKSSKLDFTTCLLAVTPGGIQETSLLAQDLGGDTAVVIVMHTVRLVAVICFFPIVLTWFV